MTRATAVAGVLAISFAAIFVRLAEVDPAVSTFFRLAYAVPILGVAWLFVRGRDTRTRRRRLLAAGAGALLAADLTLFHHSINLIGAGLGTVLANTQVFFVGVAAWVLHQERPTTVAKVMIPIVFLGLAFISGLGRTDAYGSDPVGGVLLGLGAGILYAGFLIGFRASNRGHLAPTPGPLFDATAGATVMAFVLGQLFGGLSFTISWPDHGWLVALAIVVQVGGWLLIAVALPRLPALDTSALLLIQPIAAIIWARILFDESLSPLQLAGVTLVIAGVGVMATRGTVQVPSTKTS